MKRRILLYPGSFNPIHVGHLALCNYVVEHLEGFEELWLMLSPANPLKDSSRIMSDAFRARLVASHMGRHPRMRLALDELELPRPSYTYHTLAHMREKYPTCEFSLLIGMDSLRDMPCWFRFEEILSTTHVYVYPRWGYSAPEELLHEHVHLIQAPIYELSSTMIRQTLRRGGAVPYWVGLDPQSDLYRDLELEVALLAEEVLPPA